ncbi:MAG: PTS sugar transporter subunit IIA [Candidatus Muiribacteriota bacterium]
MEVDTLLKKEYIILNPVAQTKEEMLQELCDFSLEKRIISNKDEFLKILKNREKLGSTGIGKNIAIPHGRSECVKNLSLVFARHDRGIDFDSLDGESAKIFFLLAAPLKVESKYLQVLAQLSMLLRSKSFRSEILSAKNPEEVLKIIHKNEKVL